MKAWFAALVCFAVFCSLCAAIRDDNDVAFIKESPEQLQQEFDIAAQQEMEGGPVVNGQPKSEWPELVGKTADEAKQVLESEAQGYRIQILQHGMMATADYRTDRVRVWLDAADLVSRAPRIG